MLCDDCKQKEAVFDIKFNNNGIISHEHLCQDCYYKRKSSMLLAAFGGMDGPIGRPLLKERRCSVCKTSVNTINETCFVGCPNCYKELADYIMPTIKNIQNSTSHQGKIPRHDSSQSRERERLLTELNKAREEEDYLRAAQINEQLKRLNGDI